MNYLSLWTTKRHRGQIVVVTVLVLAMIGAIIFLLVRQPKSADINNVDVVKARVGKIFLLPTDEVPALATVTDSKKLSSSLASKAINGDKILIYKTNKRIIIYRPSIDKIIDVQPVEIDDVNTHQKL